jgi:cold shock CspA family protein/ribosome-associated translation inhibitor RaiA
MQTPLHVTFRDMPSSPSVEARIRQRAEELEQLHRPIAGCHVVVEARRQRPRQERLYHVAVHLVTPGGEILATRSPADHHAGHEDIHVAIRDAFDAARRQLEDRVRHWRADMKGREAPPRGVVERLFVMEDCGFIRSADGQEIYFHRNSVVGGHYDTLRIGTKVRFAVDEGEGAKERRASSVVAIGRHHLCRPAF